MLKSEEAVFESVLEEAGYIIKDKDPVSRTYHLQHKSVGFEDILETKDRGLLSCLRQLTHGNIGRCY